MRYQGITPQALDSKILALWTGTLEYGILTHLVDVFDFSKQANTAKTSHIARDNQSSNVGLYYWLVSKVCARILRLEEYNCISCVIINLLYDQNFIQVKMIKETPRTAYLVSYPRPAHPRQ